MAEKKKKTLRMWQTLLAIAIVLSLIVGGVMMVKNLIGGKSDKPKKPPKISLIPNTPPPPPPPPPKEEKKPPEPPKEQKEIKMEQQAEQKQAPPDPQLKMEGAAGNGPSAFAQGSVTNEDLSKLGSGGGGTNKESVFNPFNNYAGLMKAELQRLLARRSELKRRSYRVEVRVWVANDGSVKQSELLGTSGDADTDESIRQAMTALPAFSELPPPNMPQPVRLRIVASGRS